MSGTKSAEHRDRATIREAFEAFSAGNAVPFFGMLNENVIVEIPSSTGLPWGKRLEGKTAVAEAMAGIMQLGSYTRFELIDIFSSGSEHMVQMREAFEFIATGEQVDLEQVFLYSMRHGQVVSIKEWTDTALIRDAYQRAVSTTSRGTE